MAAYNGAALIGETLRSLARQSFGDFEVIVADDGSADGTADLVAAWPDPRVRLLRMGRNGGPVLARNAAIAHARGRYVAALDQDDLCRPDRFRRQVAHLDRHPDVVLLGAAAAMLEDGVVRRSDHAPVTTPRLIEWLLRIENPLVWSTAMLRRDVAAQLAPFTRPELVYAEDFDLYHRLGRLGRIARLDEVLLDYRVHAGGISKRFVGRMRTSAMLVLAEAHAPLLGPRADEAAALLVDHLMLRAPVAGRTELAALGRVLGEAQAAYLRANPHSRDDRRLIRWETARRWARVARAGLRAGTLGVADVLAVRPDHLGLGYAGLDGLLWSGLVGGTKRAARRTGLRAA